MTVRSQKVFLNGQYSNLKPVLSGVPQGSIRELCFSLIYISDWPDGLKYIVKLFADNISHFSVVINKEESATDLTNDRDTISKWAHNWEILFNPKPKKPAQEVLFSISSLSNITHPVIYFNVHVQRANQQKHLGISLDKK